MRILTTTGMSDRARDVVTTSSATVSRTAVILRDTRVLQAEVDHVMAPKLEELQEMTSEGTDDATAAGKGPFKCYVTLFSREFDTHPPPHNANNVEPYTFVTVFSGKADTPHDVTCLNRVLLCVSPNTL